MRCYEIPEAGLNAKGVAIVNFAVAVRSDETISAVIKMEVGTATGNYLFMCTKKA